jgi:membrane peptidoglycan carboxypeptidase
VRNAAVVAMDPATGHVLAMVGSPDYFDPRIDGAVNATTATRQPGSSIKPITYAAAMDPARPNPLTPATMVVDVRTAFVTREGDPYVPQNYDHQWRGPVLLRQALASSYNLVAVKVLDYVGIEAMTSLARAMGITTFDDANRFGLALTLGGGEVRLLELTGAYAAFANNGTLVEPVTITRVEDATGRVLKTAVEAPRMRVMDERVAYLITDILGDNMARASTFGEGSPLHLSRPAAAKTGTTTDWRDNWAVGYTPDLVVGVWAGNANNEPMHHVSGVTGAAPIWHDVMEELLKGRPAQEFKQPAGLVRLAVCTDSGMLPATPPSDAATPLSRYDATTLSRYVVPCPRTVDELFIEGTQPTRADDWHWLYRIDMRDGLLAGPGCSPQFVARKRYTLYPAEAQEWAHKQGIPRPPEMYSPLCASGEETSVAAGLAPANVAAGLAPANVAAGLAPAEVNQAEYPLVMTSPDQGSRYRLSPEIPKASQQLMVRVRPSDGVALRQVTLLVDGRPLATFNHPPYQALWPMTPGRHVFAALGAGQSGEELRSNGVTVEVGE